MRLARVNTFLLIAILSINAYIVAAPLTPIITLWVDRHTSKPVQLHAQLHPTTAVVPLPIPQDNRLVIPSMLLDIPINEGVDARALRSGAWHRPRTSTPDKGSNMVIAAHRFTYTQPKGTFYHLDVMKPGDEIGLFWHGKRYVYTVRETKTVPPTTTKIEAATNDARLTLYTCTPLWSPKDRLVVIASPQETP